MEVMMKKLGNALLVGTMFMGLMSSPVAFANDTVTENVYETRNEAKDSPIKKFIEELDYNKGLNRDGENKQQLIERFLAYGDTLEKAEYYAKLDILVGELERAKLEVDYTGAKLLDEEYTRTHPDEMKERLLQLDPDAWLTMLESNAKARQESLKDFEEIKSQNQSFFSMSVNEPQSIVKIKYPDGSVLTSSSKTTSSVESKDGIKENVNSRFANSSPSISTSGIVMNPHVAGPWRNVGSFEASKLYTSGVHSNQYIASWEQSSGRTNVFNVVKFQVKNNGSANAQKWTTILTDVDFDATGTGVLERQSKSRKLTSSTTSNAAVGGNQYVMGYTQGTFKTTASFSAGVSGFGLSFEAGQVFSQYAIQEISGSAILTPFIGAS